MIRGRGPNKWPTYSTQVVYGIREVAARAPESALFPVFTNVGLCGQELGSLGSEAVSGQVGVSVFFAAASPDVGQAAFNLRRWRHVRIARRWRHERRRDLCALESLDVDVLVSDIVLLQLEGYGFIEQAREAGIRFRRLCSLAV